MDVRISRAGNLEVDYVVDGRDIKTARSDICGEEHRVRHVCKPGLNLGYIPVTGRRKRDRPVKVLQPLALLQLGMQGESVDVQQLDQGHKPPNAIDRGKENKGFAGVS